MAFELAADRRSVAEIPLKWGPYLAYGNVVLNGGAVLSGGFERGRTTPDGCDVTGLGCP